MLDYRRIFDIRTSGIMMNYEEPHVQAVVTKIACAFSTADIAAPSTGESGIRQVRADGALAAMGAQRVARLTRARAPEGHPFATRAMP